MESNATPTPDLTPADGLSLDVGSVCDYSMAPVEAPLIPDELAALAVAFATAIGAVVRPFIVKVARLSEAEQDVLAAVVDLEFDRLETEFGQIFGNR